MQHGHLLAVCVVAVSGCATAGEGNGGAFDAAGTGDDGPTFDAGSDAATGGDASEGSAPDTSGDAGAGAGDASSADAPPDLDAAGDGLSKGPSKAFPIGEWQFDEGSGASSADLSGHGHPAVLKGAASWTAAGKHGAGLALDGVSGYADVGVTLVDTTASFTVLAWANLASTATWEVVLSEDDVTGSLFGVKLRGDGSRQFDFDAELTDVQTPPFIVAQSTTVAQAGTWVHLAGVYDASGAGTLKLYVNGAVEANAAIGRSLVAATGRFLIGRGLYNGVAGSYFAGTVDDVAVYDVALTDAQIATLYAAQK
jgi:hypothetical protein